jgi:hypothetical protein
MRRREFLLVLTALLGAHRPAFSKAHIALAAAWQTGNEYQVGVLQQDSAGALRIVQALDVPTRAHGLLREASGALLAVARRPGDWLLRWDRAGRAVTWRWIEPQRAFSGHVVVSEDGRTLYTTEIELDTGVGLVGVRDAASLEKSAEWPTHGIDAHELIWDIIGKNRLIVANGGVPTRPETGRVKRDLARMDSSLVRLDTGTGELLGQWRLDDRRLSLRHMAWNCEAVESVLGIALQAEHDDPAAKASAPVLALFDGHSLRTAPAPIPLAGYGGDIASLGRSFAVSCPRAQGVALHSVDGAWRRLIPLEEACALVATPAEIWAGGCHAALTLSGEEAPGSAIGRSAAHPVPDIRLDNHWIAI